MGISMNRHDDEFPDEIMKRAFLVYTKTALPVYKPEGWWIEAETDRLIARERVNQYGKGRVHLFSGCFSPIGRRIRLV